MNGLIRFSLLVLMLTAMLSSTNAQANNMEKLGNMDVHYIALNATFLTPKIAKAYGIERSRYNGLINIAVMDNTKEGRPAKTVSITGTAKNLAGQNKSIEFVEVKEGDAIYYLAQVGYSNEEVLKFDLKINDGIESQQLKFSQKFYVD